MRTRKQAEAAFALAIAQTWEMTNAEVDLHKMVNDKEALLALVELTYAFQQDEKAVQDWYENFSQFKPEEDSNSCAIAEASHVCDHFDWAE